MGKRTNVVSLKDVKAAQAFLKAIGANWQNTDLIYSVVAWMRAAGGSGNNPFNLRGPDRSYVKIVHGRRKVIKRDGLLLKFDSLTAGLLALAKYLKDEKTSWNGYGLILRAFRSGDAAQALTAIAISAWDGAHYGYDLLNPDLTVTSLYKIYTSFTGLTLPGAKTTVPGKTITFPPPVRDLPPPPQMREYIDPSEARRFYEARHKDPLFLE